MTIKKEQNILQLVNQVRRTIYKKQTVTILVSSVLDTNLKITKKRLPSRLQILDNSFLSNVKRDSTLISKSVRSCYTRKKDILVSLSGGQDSIFLLFLFYLIERQIGLKRKVVWCNHLWQKDSFYTTLHVTKSAYSFFSSILAFVALHDVLSERTARDWRHLVTDRASTFYSQKSCSYGHTQNDQVETVLFNLMRGTGTYGVTSLQSERDYSSFSYNRLYPTKKLMQQQTHL